MSQCPMRRVACSSRKPMYGRRSRCRHGPRPCMCASKPPITTTDHRPPTTKSTNLRVWPGQPYPLGATWDGEGVNFAIFSENATHVELCLFHHEDDATEAAKIQIRDNTDQVWHCYLPDVRPGQYYGHRGPIGRTSGRGKGRNLW